MGIINVLDENVANLIAAGEVVERPASVVKELTENALDAGADRITVEIKNGGVSLIRVTDNGCGMAPEDVPTSLLRHATSKIKDKRDLSAIMTLGFRGEALAAIASVSKLRIITKSEDGEGTLLVSKCGKIEELCETGCAPGTTVIVEELFENVPARRKFLKRDMTETAAVGSVCERLALSRPDVSVTYIADNEMRFKTVGDGKLKNAIYTVFGRTFAGNLIQVSSSDGRVGVEGYVGSPMNCRGNRAMQIFFLNGRYIKSRTVQSALEEACVSFIPREKYPCAVLNITVHPGCVDVNVHPAKTEVKFSDERTVFDGVYYAVKTAVTDGAAVPRIEIPPPTPSFAPVVPIEEEGAEKKRAEAQLSIESVKEGKPASPVPFIPRRAEVWQPQRADTVRSPKFDEANPGEASVTEPETVATAADGTRAEDGCGVAYRYIGELFGTYLIVEAGDEAYIIDKHAAHERIIFEEMKRAMQGKVGSSQLLLVPVELAATDTEYAACCEQHDSIRKAGFDFSYENGLIYLTEIPSNLNENEAAELFLQIMTTQTESVADPSLSAALVYERSLYQSACKAAIKGGDVNTRGDLQLLADKLMRCPDITYCPHGRPVAFVMSKGSVEHRFKRG